MICMTCGTEYPGAAAPGACAICLDERQYVGWGGQRWSTPEALARDHRVRFEEAAGVTTLEGSAGLWWKDGPRAGGSLFPGDAKTRVEASVLRSYAALAA